MARSVIHLHGSVDQALTYEQSAGLLCIGFLTFAIRPPYIEALS
jgi:hypothetical protein